MVIVIIIIIIIIIIINNNVLGTFTHTIPEEEM